MSLGWLPPVISSPLLFSCKRGSIMYLNSFLLSSSRNWGLTETCCLGLNGLNNRSRSFLTKDDFTAAVVEGTRVPRSRPSVTPPALVGTCAVHQQLEYINIIRSQKKSKGCPKGKETYSSDGLESWVLCLLQRFDCSHARKFKFSFSLQKQQRATRPDVSGREKSGKSRPEWQNGGERGYYLVKVRNN